MESGDYPGPQLGITTEGYQPIYEDPNSETSLNNSSLESNIFDASNQELRASLSHIDYLAFKIES